MKAVIKRGPDLVVGDIPVPQPGPGQVLVRTLHCGICGSDLHALNHNGAMIDAGRRTGLATGKLDPDADIVFGHEFCAEVVDYGPDTDRRIAPGTAVCALAVNFDAQGVEGVGYSNRYNGAFAEYFILTESLLLPVTNGLPTDVAALTEPMAVAVHAVAKADTSDSAYLVVGCGPIGLAIIIELKARGLGPVVAADFQPERRALAERLGADIVVDPASSDPHGHWEAFGIPTGLMDLAAAGGKARRAVIFECVGAPGVLNAIICAAPPAAQVIVAGVCMSPDRIEPMIANNKEIELRFTMAYSGEEFAETLHRLCEGPLDAAPMITGTTGLDGVPDAFQQLAQAPRHANIMVCPC